MQKYKEELIPVLLLGSIADVTTNAIGFAGTWGFSTANGISIFESIQIIVTLAFTYFVGFLSLKSIGILKSQDDELPIKMLVIIVLASSFYSSFAGVCKSIDTGEIRINGFSLYSIDFLEIFSRIGALKFVLGIVFSFAITMCIPILGKQPPSVQKNTPEKP